MILDGESLDISAVKQVVYQFEAVAASQASMSKVAESRLAVEKIVEDEKIIYGITTGFGKFSDVLIAKADVESLQENLIRSHACGVGEPFSEEVSRAMVLLRLNALLKGFSGVRPILIEHLITLLNKRIHPVVPQQGSLGASGDLAPLSHLALVLIGEGDVYYHGKCQHTIDVYKQLGITSLKLTAKEGLALINGTQAMTAQGVIATIEARRLAYQSEAISAMTMEALRGIITAFDDNIHQARGYQEQIDVASRIRSYLFKSRLTTVQGEKRVQDAYSLRCIPQVHGATWQTLNYVIEKLEIEINAATDNPLIFDHGEKVISGGNFHGEPIALAMDFLGIAMAELANISERRVERLVNPHLNEELPAFLSTNPGLESGVMILQYTAASLVSENKTLAHPASVDSIPSSGNQEDHVSMGTIAARHAYQIITNARRVLAIELICAMQALEYRDTKKMATATHNIYLAGREITPMIQKDRIFSKDIELVNQWLMSDSWEQFLIKDGGMGNE